MNHYYGKVMDKVNMTALARQAMVSQSTVSRVLSGDAAVAADKRERVLAAADLLGYRARPRRAAREAARRGFGILLLDGAEKNPGVILSKLDSLIRRLPRRARLEILPGEISPLQLESMRRKGELTGLFLFGHGKRNRELAGALRQIPHVWLNSHDWGGGEEGVLLGNEAAGRLAARYLAERGCRNPGVAGFAANNPGFRSRVDGFRFEFFRRNGECRLIDCAGQAGFEELSDREIEAIFAARLGELAGCDGLFVPEDRLAALAARAFGRCGAARPRLIGCGNETAYLAGLWPRPATIDLGSGWMAEAAIELLLRRAAGSDATAAEIVMTVTPTLVPGDES